VVVSRGLAARSHGRERTAVVSRAVVTVVNCESCSRESCSRESCLHFCIQKHKYKSSRKSLPVVSRETAEAQNWTSRVQAQLSRLTGLIITPDLVLYSMFAHPPT